MTPKQQLAEAEKLAKRETAKRKREEKAAYDLTPKGQLEKAKKEAKKTKQAEVAKAIHEEFMDGCKIAGFPAPIPEFKFSERKGWRFDYFFRCGERMVAVEVEGGLDMAKSGHKTAAGIRRDMAKYNEAARNGIWVVRVEPHTLNYDSTFHLIKELLSCF
jgi:hypothetical protein